MTTTLAGESRPLATEEDLAETAALVEKLDRRIVTRKADMRDRAQPNSALEAGIAEFGRLDVVLANAGIREVNR